jgi:outer membrane protein TolC
LATGYNYARSSSTAGFALFNQSNGLNGGLTFSWNLFNGGQLKTRMTQAQLAIENDAIKIRQAESQVNASIQIAIRQWQQASELLKLEEENFLSAKENVSLALERLRLGNAGILVVKEAQRSYEEAISRQSAAALLAKQAEIELMRLAGKLVR